MNNSILLIFMIFTSISLNCQIDQLQYKNYLLIGPMEYDRIDENIQKYYFKSLQDLKNELIKDLDYLLTKDSLILEDKLNLNIDSKGYRGSTEAEISLIQFFNKHYPECGKKKHHLSENYEYLVVRKDALIALLKEDLLLIEEYHYLWEEAMIENKLSKFLKAYEAEKCYEVYSNSLVYKPGDYELIIQNDMVFDTLISEIRVIDYELSGGWKPKIICKDSLNVNCKIGFYTQCIVNCEIFTSVGYKSLEYIPSNYSYNNLRNIFEKKILIPQSKYKLINKNGMEIRLNDWREIQCN